MSAPVDVVRRVIRGRLAGRCGRRTMTIRTRRVMAGSLGRQRQDHQQVNQQDE